MSELQDRQISSSSELTEKKPQTTHNEHLENPSNQTGESSSVSNNSGSVIEVFRDGSIKNDDYEIPNTEDMLYDQKKNIRDHLGILFICVLIAFGGFLFGFDIGYIGGLFSMGNFKKHFGSYNASKDKYYFNNAKTGIIVSIFTFGACFGGICLSSLPNKYGRRFALSSVCVLYMVGVLIQITCTEHKHAWIQLLIGRLVSGFAFGGVGSTAPLLLAETAPAKLRSICVSFYQLMITFGVFLGKCCNLGTKRYPDTSSAQWRIQIGLCFFWAMLVMTGISFVPESARYYVQQNKVDDARKTLAKLNNVSEDDPLLQRELDTLVYSIEAEKLVQKGSYKDLFSTKTKVLQRLLNGIVLQSLQQLTGANYFLYYGTLLFKTVGLKDSYTTSVIIGIINFGSTFFSFFVVHRFGRRQVLFFGAILMSICMLIYACIGTQSLYPHGMKEATSKSAGDVMIAFTCIYIFIYSTTWAPLAFVVCSESFPLNVKSLCISINIGTHFMWASIISFFTPFITGAIHFYYGFVFFGCLVFSIFFVFFFIPETKDLTLEEVNELWMDGIPPWRSANWIPYQRRGGNYNEEMMNEKRGFSKFF